jgi:hypothetical protein
MALPFNDPSQFVQYDGPNGPVAIPQQYAGNFVLPPPPVALPPPAFDPSAPLPLPEPAMPPDPTGPVPSLFEPPAPEPAGLPIITPEERSQLPILPPPKPAPQTPVAAQPPPTALDVSMGALQQRQEVARQRGEVESRAADAEASIYAEADRREADLTKARADEVAAEKKERDRAKAGIKDASDRYLNYKVDENRRWSNLSTPRKILAGIGVLLSGLGNALAKKGSASNGALDYIMATIKEDTRLQMDERAQLGAAVGMKKDELNDLRSQFSDSEAAFQAAYGTNVKWAANKLRTVASAAKSETARLEGMDRAAELEALGGQLIDAAEERNYSRKIDDRNFNAAERRHRQGLAESRAGRTQAQANADRAFSQGQYEFERTMDARAQAAQAEADAKRAAGDTKAAEAIEKKAKEERQEAVFSPRGEPLKKKDGTLWLTGDTARSTELRNQIGNTSKMMALGQKLVAARQKYGWSSNLANSAEMQEMKQVFSDMQLTEKDVRALGAISGTDATFLSNVLGAEDPTSFKDPTPGIKSYLKNTEIGLNAKLRGQGYTGDPITFPDLRDTDPGLAAYDDPEVQSVLQYDESKRSVLGGRSAALGKPAVGFDQFAGMRPEPGKLGQLNDRGKSMFAGYTQKQEDALLSFADRAVSGDESGRARLEVAAKESSVPEVRAIAAELLKQVDAGAYESRPAQIQGAISKVRAALGAPVKE